MGEACLRVCTDTRHSNGCIWTKSWAEAHVEICTLLSPHVFMSENEMVKMSGPRNKSKGEKKKCEEKSYLETSCGTQILTELCPATADSRWPVWLSGCVSTHEPG